MSNPDFLVYDIEVYPNFFCCVFQNPHTEEFYCFEHSDRKNQISEFVEFLKWVKAVGIRLVGYNNVAFDMPCINDALTDSQWDGRSAYAMCDRIISAPFGSRSPVAPWELLIPQVDLYLIHHFNNKAKRQSLKGLELAMRMDDVRDIPIVPGTDVRVEDMDELISYCYHDVRATTQFFHESKDQIAFRDQLSAKYEKDFTNYSDVKCGVEVLIIETERAKPGSCYDDSGKPRQTKRSSITLADVILPSVEFTRYEFKSILDEFRSKTIKETKGVFEDMSATVDGFEFVFGLGGIHGSIESQTVRSDDDRVIIDLDVASYYPNLAIVNDVYPEHLSSDFCSIYKSLYEERKKHKKGTAENAMLKLALNGTYGNSNNKYSPLYDPQYTMAITVNGQLLLCMLAERMMDIPDLRMIQANTDGITVSVPRAHKWLVDEVSKWWQGHTGLVLEEGVYSAMYVRDVNSYFAVYDSGKVKMIGAYNSTPLGERVPVGWHQNPSMFVVPKAVEDHLLNGTPVEEAVRSVSDPHDFIIRVKVGRSDKVVDEHGKVYQWVGRFFVSKQGVSLTKLSPPKGPLGGWKRKNGLSDEYYNGVRDSLYGEKGDLDEQGYPWDERINTGNRSRYEERTTSLCSGKATMCNHISEFDWTNLDWDYYISETRKLIDPLLNT